MQLEEMNDGAQCRLAAGPRRLLGLHHCFIAGFASAWLRMSMITKSLACGDSFSGCPEHIRKNYLQPIFGTLNRTSSQKNTNFLPRKAGLTGFTRIACGLQWGRGSISTMGNA